MIENYAFAIAMAGFAGIVVAFMGAYAVRSRRR